MLKIKVIFITFSILLLSFTPTLFASSVLYQAESMSLSGSSTIMGASNGSSRGVGTLAGEASGRQAVKLTKNGDAISFVTTADANTIVVRYSIPDAQGGGGIQDTLGLTVYAPNRRTQLFPNENSPEQDLTLTSRYAWVYGTTSNPGGALRNVPPPIPIPYITKLYDETSMQFGQTIPAGSIVKLVNKTSTKKAFTIDFVELELVPDPIPQPAGYISLTQDCGVKASSNNALGTPTDKTDFNYVFSGVDDTLFPDSVFHAYTGPNPINPINNPDSRVYELDYYTSSIDSTMNALADENTQNLINCLSLNKPIYVPVGRYYMRGAVPLPSNTQIQGAGMWYSKFVAVNTGAPVPVTIGTVEGVQGQTGNLTFVTQGNATTQVNLSDFSMFGNVTQRDTLDDHKPVAINGQFTNSTFNNLWIEHYRIGIQMTGNSSDITYSNSRVRNTYADGFDFYGGTTNSTIENCQARGTGDDGISIWSQSSPGVTGPSSYNLVTNCDVSLNWFSHGIAIYGGENNTVTDSTVTDTLANACLDMGSQFTPYPIPTMTANANNLVLTRCGGPTINSSAIMATYDNSTIPTINLNFSDIDIYSPSYGGIGILDKNTSIPDTPKIYPVFNNVNVLTSPINVPCVTLSGNLKGALTLDNTYACSSTTAKATACTVKETTAFPVNVDSPLPKRCAM
jgi:parallel beta-helix repeat protein